MRIMHICLAGLYMDGYGYQENMLVEQHIKNGHEVVVAAGTKILKDGVLVDVPMGRSVTSTGVIIERIPPSRLLVGRAGNRLRVYPGLAELLERYQPELVFFHSIASYELYTAAKYKKTHPSTVLLADSHASRLNSGMSFISLLFQHKLFYRTIYRLSRKHIDRIFYIGMEEKDYLREVLRIPEGDIEFLPLGGMIVPPEERRRNREQHRRELGVAEDGILLIHSGKLLPDKRTDVLLDAMGRIKDERLRLIIIGSAEGKVLDNILRRCESDKRISFLGWKTSSQLTEYLCAADLYLQPGTVSATIQNAMCCAVPCVSHGYETYKREFGENSGVMYADTPEQYAELLTKALCGDIDLKWLGSAALMFAANNLDYAEQAKRIEAYAAKS